MNKIQRLTRWLALRSARNHLRSAIVSVAQAESIHRTSGIKVDYRDEYIALGRLLRDIEDRLS